jgi:nucleoside-diphosphate-sugar epimerase
MINLNILITGGAGYLGSTLSQKLLSKGHKIRVLDDLWYGKEPIQECLKNENFELIQDDLRNLTTIVKSLKEIDGVIHLASVVGMPASSIEPRTSEEINYLVTKNIAELCTLHEIPTYVFSSTCSVYGSQPKTMITEKSKVSPMDYYAKQKYLSERAINWLNTAPTILRFGTLFGYSKRMRFDLVINLFIAQSILENKITVFGGNQFRPFLHVKDAAESLVFAIEKDLTGTYNVISENMTILDAAKQISKLSGCEIVISDENEDKRNYQVSGEKIKQMGFKPQFKIKDAYNEIKKKIEEKEIKNFNDKKYSNYKLLFGSKEMQQRVFLEGI